MRLYFESSLKRSRYHPAMADEVCIVSVLFISLLKKHTTTQATVTTTYMLITYSTSYFCIRNKFPNAITKDVSTLDCRNQTIQICVGTASTPHGERKQLMPDASACGDIVWHKQIDDAQRTFLSYWAATLYYII